MIDDIIGEVVGGAVEVAADIVIDKVNPGSSKMPRSKKKNSWREALLGGLVYAIIVLIIISLLIVAGFIWY